MLGGITSHNNSVTFPCHLLRSLNALGFIGKEMLYALCLCKQIKAQVFAHVTHGLYFTLNLFFEEEYNTEMELIVGELIQ